MNTLVDNRREDGARGVDGGENKPSREAKISLSALSEERPERRDFKEKPKGEGIDIDSIKLAILNKLSLSKHDEKKEADDTNSDGVAGTN